jgi:hypothetical protein
METSIYFMSDENGQKRRSAKKTAIVPARDRVHGLLTDPREILLLRLLHGGLNEHEIAFELRGSHGFADCVKAHVRKVLHLESIEALSAFATQWCEANPLPVQQSLEVVKPPTGLGPFAVVHDKIHERSCRHRIYLLPNESDVQQRRQLLDQYIRSIIDQYVGFNFSVSGGSTINGQTAPGWETLRKFWPRRILIGKTFNQSPSDSVEISYDRHLPQSSGMVRALYSWLDAQFNEHAYCIFVKSADSEELIYLDDLPKQQGSAKSFGLN